MIREIKYIFTWFVFARTITFIKTHSIAQASRTCEHETGESFPLSERNQMSVQEIDKTDKEKGWTLRTQINRGRDKDGERTQNWRPTETGSRPAVAHQAPLSG